MREILFRGKLANGKWAYGNLDVKKTGVCIITPDDTPIGSYGQVDTETVGQYTGLVDAHRRKIFEGQLVTATLEATVAQPEFSWGACEVVFREGCFGLQTDKEFIPFRSFAPRVAFEIIGDVYHSAGLFEGE